MATRSQKVKLGVFLTTTTLLLIIVVAVLTGLGLWQERLPYYIEFRQSVSGLESGAPVKLRGVRVGTVDGIRVNPKNVEIVEVRIEVDKGTPIKTDTKAYINMQGITGLKFIELGGGTAKAKRLPAGSEIQAGQSMFEQLTGRATDIGVKVEKLLNNILYMTREKNQKRVDDIVSSTKQTTEHLAEVTDQLTKTLEVTRQIAVDNRQTIAALLKNANETSTKTNQVLGEINRLATNANGVLAQSKIPETVAQFRQTNQMVQEQLRSLNAGTAMQKVTVALDTLTTLLQNLSQTVNQNQDQIRATLYNLRQAAESFKELARSLNAKPSRLFFNEKPKQRKLP